MLSIFIGIFARPALAADLCNSRDDKQDLQALEKYFEASLKRHGELPFARPLKSQASAKAKAFQVQDLTDKRAELCADRLRLAEEIKKAPSQYETGECGAAAVVTLLDSYMRKVAAAYDSNAQKLNSYQKDHLKALKLRLFEIAKGSTIGLEGVASNGVAIANAPKEVKYEWIKSQASMLAKEAHVAWGAVDPAKNPLVQLNHILAREAVRARNEREKQKVELRTDGKMPSYCKKK